MVIGLENDRDETTFTQGGHYNNLLEAATALRESGKVSISLAKDYAQAFLASKKLLPPQIISSLQIIRRRIRLLV